MIIFRFNKKDSVIENIFTKGSKSITALPLKRAIYINIIIAITNLLLVFSIQSKLPPEIPLFYGAAESEEQLTTSLGLSLTGIISLSVLLFNIVITLLMVNQFLRKALILSSLGVSILLFITTFKIVFLVGSL